MNHMRATPAGVVALVLDVDAWIESARAPPEDCALRAGPVDHLHPPPPADAR